MYVCIYYIPGFEYALNLDSISDMFFPIKHDNLAHSAYNFIYASGYNASKYFSNYNKEN